MTGNYYTDSLGRIRRIPKYSQIPNGHLPAKQIFNDNVMMPSGASNHRSQTIKKSDVSKYQRVVMHPYTDKNKQLHELSHRLETSEQVAKKKYDDHDFNKYLDQERIAPIKEIGLPTKVHDMKFTVRTRQELHDSQYNSIEPFEITGKDEHDQSTGSSFWNKKSLDKFLEDRGLKVTNVKTPDHAWNKRDIPTYKVTGSYQEIAVSGNAKSFDEWADKHNYKSTKIMSNGSWTEAKIKKGVNGNTLYYLNPNYPRKVFPYAWDR